MKMKNKRIQSLFAIFMIVAIVLTGFANIVNLTSANSNDDVAMDDVTLGGASSIIVHALNPEGIEIASIEGINPYCVQIYDGDTLIGYGAHNEETYNKPIAISPGAHTINVKFNGIELSQDISLNYGETKIIIFIFNRIEYSIKAHISSWDHTVSISGTTPWNPYGSYYDKDEINGYPGTDEPYLGVSVYFERCCNEAYEGFTSFNINSSGWSIDLHDYFASENPGYGFYRWFQHSGHPVFSNVSLNIPIQSFDSWFIQIIQNWSCEWGTYDEGLVLTIDSDSFPSQKGYRIYSLKADKAYNELSYYVCAEVVGTLSVEEKMRWSGEVDALRMSSVPYDLTGTGIICEEVQPPVASFTYSPENPAVSEEITFDASSSNDPDGTIEKYQWNFGDGNSTEGKVVTHAYSKAGDYTATLTVTDNDGLQNSTELSFEVSEEALPVASFNYSLGAKSHSGEWISFYLFGERMTFDASSSYDPDNQDAPNKGIVKYEWLFEGPSPIRTVNTNEIEPKAEGKEVVHTFPRDGIYKVTLTVTDGDGLKNSTSKEIEIDLPPILVKSEILGGFSSLSIGAPFGSSMPITTVLYKYEGEYLSWWSISLNWYPSTGKTTFYVSSPGTRTDREIRWARPEDVPPDSTIIGGYEKIDLPNQKVLGAWGFGEDFFKKIIERQTGSSQSDTIYAGENTFHNAQIDSMASEATFSLSWQGSDLNLVLYAPNGTKIDPITASGNSDINYVEYDTYEYYTVQNPASGMWEVETIAIEVPDEGERYTTAVYLPTNLTLATSTDKMVYNPKEQIIAKAYLMNNGTPIIGATVSAKIEKSDGSIEEIILYDDGSHNDSTADDGIYTNVYTNTTIIIGFYNITAIAIGTIEEENFERTAFAIVWVGKSTDLAISSSDIFFSQVIPNVGENIMVNAMIHNLGNTEVDNVSILFYDEDPILGNVIGKDNVDIAPKAIKNASVSWAANLGKHYLYVLISPYNEFLEENYTNNQAFKSITVATANISFDTGALANPYPSICGIHNGTIAPDVDITVNKFYTYPCAGTGGHAEYAKIYNDSWNIETLPWNGYVGDWHNLTFNSTFTLYANETYNYTIRTGSYPQIIHESPFNATGGTITCDKFIDANGRIYYDWIPAIKLFL
ncbi:MAG TPA: PKD domain-containing protein [Desulfobacteria bacterium]|nr:PKD domain-containing protein [Desulfobacteria bacterium]